MRSRMLGGLAALFALGALAMGASAATVKPKLWLLEATSHARAATGTPAHINVLIEECSGMQPGALYTNGKPVDLITSASSLVGECPGGEKLAGAIKSVAVAPAEEGQMAMTLNSVLHLQLAPWCTYALPHKIVFGATMFTQSVAEPTAPLDKAASFGSCAPTRTLHVRLEVEDELESFPFAGEVVG